VKWTGNIIKNNKDLEVGFIGNSHVMDAIDPEIVTEKTRMKSYNLALYYIPIPNMVEILYNRCVYPNHIFIDFSTRYSHYIEDYEFYENLINKKYNLRREKVLDAMAFLFPSLFIPPQFRFLTKRVVQKLKEYHRNGYPSIGRYTPFKTIIGFDWTLKKTTNHRYTIRRKPKTNIERISELFTLRKTINETSAKCNCNAPEYNSGFVILERYVKEALLRGCTVKFIRLPMDQRLIDHENRVCHFYFTDLKKMAQRLCIQFLDFNDKDVFAHLFPFSFYIDGQHLEHSSAISLSNYLSSIIKPRHD
jgi:hypothetical protein